MRLTCDQHNRHVSVNAANSKTAHVSDGSPCTTKLVKLGVLEFAPAAIANGLHNTPAVGHYNQDRDITVYYRDRSNVR